MQESGNKKFPLTQPRWDSSLKMKAIQWFGNMDVRVNEVPRPMVTEAKDAIIRVTSTTICGSDLHLYHNEFQEMEKGDILGHECVGIVDEVGPDVKTLKQGDRVVVSAIIADGECEYCKRGEFSCCDNTNPSNKMEHTYGHRCAGIFGYSHLTGGYPGAQAEYLRVPLADVNCLKITNSNLEDEKILFLSDVACTGWHANELAEVRQGDSVVIWGAGPVGLMAALWAKFRGAGSITVIDREPKRLQLAKNKLGCNIINFEEFDVIETVQDLIPGGPDCAIDAVGFRFPKSALHKLERALKLETDSPQILNECIYLVRKGGRIGIVGDYYQNCNHFPIGAFMEKSLCMRGGQVFIQKYWRELLGYIEQGKVDPTFIITHTMSLDQGAEAYKLFDEKTNDCVKVILKTHSKPQSEEAQSTSK